MLDPVTSLHTAAKVATASLSLKPAFSFFFPVTGVVQLTVVNPFGLGCSSSWSVCLPTRTPRPSSMRQASMSESRRRTVEIRASPSSTVPLVISLKVGVMGITKGNKHMGSEKTNRKSSTKE